MDAPVPHDSSTQPSWRPVINYTAVSLLLCNVHRNTFSVLLPQISAQLALSPSAAGAVQAGNLLAYLAGQLPSGRLADTLSGTRVLVVGLFLWSAATAATALPCLPGLAGATPAAAASGAQLALLLLLGSRALMGLASAAAMPCVTSISAQLVPASERGSAVSFVYACFNAGGVLGLALVPPLAMALGLPGAFIATGTAGLAWAAYGAATLPSKPADANQQEQQQQELQQPAAVEKQPQPQQQGWRLPQLSAASWQQLAVLCYAHAVMGYGFFILQNWIPMYLASLGGQGLAVTGGLSSIPWLAATLVGPLAGQAADRLIRGGRSTLSVRRLMQAVCFLGCAASVVPLALTPQPGIALAVACLTASLALYSFSHSGFHSYLQDVAAGNAGVVYGITNTCSIAAGIAGNLVTGCVVEASGSYGAVFLLFAALNLSAAAAFNAFTSTNKVEF
uniref:Major facilitator superfamily (MFS) profile domain-containing protein n=1 Tax=Tetradesmus obliquus TaxID=3088 RepID=A0A383WD31_TETOB|eukprot:jgi/Sobl393_1/15272/SZX75140.1